MTTATCSQCEEILTEDEQQDAIELAAESDVDICIGCKLLAIKSMVASMEAENETVH